jgi:beta-galactosidase
MLAVESDSKDTFIDMQDWTKRVVFVNGFALSKHVVIGPQQKLYLPGLFSQADGRK